MYKLQVLLCLVIILASTTAFGKEPGLAAIVRFIFLKGSADGDTRGGLLGAHLISKVGIFTYSCLDSVRVPAFSACTGRQL